MKLACALVATLAALASACASAPEPAPGPPLRVRIGAIGSDLAEASAGGGSLAERSERLVDLFWRGGCRGADLSRPRAEGMRSPDVACRLPGRTRETVLVATYLEPRADEDGSAPLLLPQLHAALSVEERRHTFVFVGFARRSPRGVHEDSERLEEARRDEIRAIVDLRRLRRDASAILFSSSDPSLEHPLSTLGTGSGERGPLLRLVALAHPKRAASGRDGIATIAMASLDPSRAADVSAGGGGTTLLDGPASARATARTLAVFLGYLDGTLPPRGEGSADR